MAREKADFSTGLRAIEFSIRVFSRPSGFRSDQFVSDKARRSRSLALFFIAALIAVGATFAWHSQGDEGKEMVRRRWVSSLDWLLSMSTTKSPPAPVAASTSPELARPLEAVAPDLIAASHTAEQPAAEQEQMYPDVATAKGVEQNTRSTSSPPLHSRQCAPVPETRPTTIEGWMLREVTNGTAVLEGPNGIWREKRGDTVPGVGQVEFIVLWGKRWIVATSRSNFDAVGSLIARTRTRIAARFYSRMPTSPTSALNPLNRRAVGTAGSAPNGFGMIGSC